MGRGPTEDRVERSLRAAERRAEQLAARARVGLVAAAFVIVGGLIVLSREPLLAGPAMLVTIAVWAVYAVGVWAVVRRWYSPDIRGFTSMSEQIPAETLVARLNLYWEQMVGILFEHRGTLISFVGDGLFAAFGLPASADDDADRAFAAALAMRRRIADLNASQTLLPFGPLRVGMAIHTGDVIMGNIGSPARLEFTVIGDVVNSAARLEGMNKTLGTDLLISARAVDRLSSRDGLRDVGELEIRGRHQPLHAFALSSQVQA